MKSTHTLDCVERENIPRQLGRAAGSATEASPVRLLLLATALVLTGCGKPHPTSRERTDALPVAQVRVQTVERQYRPVTEEVAGTVRAKLRATLEAKISGRVQAMPVHLGQVVKAGDLVARLDAAEVNARLEQAQASLEQAQREWNRVSSLFKGQAVTRAEQDSAESRQRLAKAAVAEAEAMMRYLEVLAPFDGVVSRKSADVGDQASPGKPLVEIEDPSSLQLEADLPESIAAQVELGASLAVRLDRQGGQAQAKVAELAPSADPASRTVRVKLDLVPTAGLAPGRFARLLVPVGETSSVGVSSSAVVERGQLEIVFVITNQQARLHLVKTGARFGEQVEVLSGLEAGEVVAMDGAGRLADGQRVEIK